MELDRVIELHTPGLARGSGCLIAAGLILTAKHAVGGVGTPCRWRRLVQTERDATAQMQPFADAEVAWVSDQIDVALVAPRGGGVFVAGLPSLKLGALAPGEAISVAYAGYPHYLVDDERSDRDVGRARVDAARGARAGALLLDLAGSAPTDKYDWQGISGGPVFAGDVLVGHLERVPARLPSTVLQAVPVRRWVDDAGAAALLAANGMHMQAEAVGAADVAALPASGSWAPLRERYRQAVLKTFCTLNRAGLLAQQASAPVPAAAAYAALKFTPEKTSAPVDTHSIQPPGVADAARLSRLVLTGEPGAGKSTVLKQALGLVAQPGGLLPIWLPLAELPDDKRQLTAERIVVTLVEQAHEQLLLAEVNADFFKAALSEAPFAVVAFDALDEAGGRARRDQVREALTAFSLAWPHARVWVSSRPGAYAEAPLPQPPNPDSEPSDRPLPAPWQRWTVAPLDASDVPAFLRIACHDDGSLADALAARADLESLTRSPLTLTMLAGMVVRGGLPADAASVFDSWVRTLCEQWDEAKGERASPDEYARRIDALRAIGWAVQERGEPATPFTRQLARQALSEVCSGSARDALLAVLLDRTGLIATVAGGPGEQSDQAARQPAPGALRFVHLQIQEYLAGAHLAARYADEPEAALAALQGRWFRPDWLEPLGFALAELARDADLHDELLQVVQGLDEPFEDLLARRTRLLARLLARVPRADPALVQQVVAELVRVIAQRQHFQLDACDALIHLAHHAAARPALRELARGAAWVGAIYGSDEYPTPSDAHPWRMRAVVALARAQGAATGRAEGLRLLDAIEPDAPDLPALLRCLQARAEWGQRQAAEARLAALFRLQALPPSDEPINELAVRQAVDRVLTDVGSPSRADQLIDELLRDHVQGDTSTLSFDTLLWAVQRGRLAPDAPLMNAHFESLRQQVMASLSDLYAPHELSARLHAAVALAPEHSSPALQQLFAATLRHQGLIWQLGGAVCERFPALASEAVRIMAAYVLDPEQTDRSRRNGTIHALVHSTDDAAAVPVLLELLQHLPALRWEGQRMAKSLRDRGYGPQALAVLQAQLRPERTDTDLNERIVDAARCIDPMAVDGWLDGRYRRSVAPPSHVQIDGGAGEPELPTRAQLEQALADATDSYDTTRILGRLVEIGEGDAALHHADDWLAALLPPQASTAPELGARLCDLSQQGVWCPAWCALLAQATRLVEPAKRQGLVDVLEYRVSCADTAGSSSQ